MKKDIKDLDVSNMTDEEIDEYYRPQKSNSRKSLAPLYVYIILTEHSSSQRHLSQLEIMQYLEKEYELVLERKAISRIIHTLSGEGICIYNSSKGGAWFDPLLK